tara:strand:+ start:331 stop:912 length:582 start_codon:yes stop_codon:yes gene_type:complete
LKKQHLDFNPLGNLTPFEKGASYVWGKKTLNFLVQIRSEKASLYCIEGKKGTGKTTLLQNLEYQLEDSKYHSFKKNEKVDLTGFPESILIFDRVYNLSIKNRIKIWKSEKTIIYSAHMDTYGFEQLGRGKKEKLKLGRKKFEELKEIVSKKFEIQNLKMTDFGEAFSDESITVVCEKHSGNPREVIKELYYYI